MAYDGGLLVKVHGQEVSTIMIDDGWLSIMVNQSYW